MQTIAVIPAQNEAGALGAVLAELGALPRGVLDGVIVVDGNSTDQTVDVARRAGAQALVQARRGYGAACWEGFQAASKAGAGVVVFLDGDGSDPPAAIPQLIEVVTRSEADLVLGCRVTLPGQTSTLPWHARAGNALVCSLLRWRTGGRVSDLPPMKALRVARLAELDMQEMGYGWTTEMIAKGLRRGWRIAEVSVVSRPRASGVSKVSGRPGASARAGYALIRTALRDSRRPSRF